MTKKEEEILVKMLKDAKNVFLNNGLEFWLDCGTLLGAIRDNGFIPWENDIDLGAWKSKNDFEEKRKIRKEFIKLGYEVYLTDYYVNIHLKEHSDLNLDINYYTKENGMANTIGLILLHELIDKKSKLVNHLLRFLYNRKLFVKRLSVITRVFLKVNFSIIYMFFIMMPPSLKSKFLDFLINTRKKITNHKAFLIDLQYFEGLKKTSVFNGEYLIPNNSEEYLKYRYGDDWKTPIQQWDTYTQDRTVRENI
jgi:lipopolysaccharide cholinephosphotransferase